MVQKQATIQNFSLKAIANLYWNDNFNRITKWQYILKIIKTKVNKDDWNFDVFEREYQKKCFYKSLKSKKKHLLKTGIKTKCNKCKLSNTQEKSHECQPNIIKKIKSDDCIIYFERKI